MHKFLRYTVALVLLFSLFTCGGTVPTKERKGALSAIEKAKLINADKYAPKKLKSSEEFFNKGEGVIDYSNKANPGNVKAKGFYEDSQEYASLAYDNSVRKFIEEIYESNTKLIEENKALKSSAENMDEYNKAIGFYDQANDLKKNEENFDETIANYKNSTKILTEILEKTKLKKEKVDALLGDLNEKIENAKSQNLQKEIDMLKLELMIMHNKKMNTSKESEKDSQTMEKKVMTFKKYEKQQLEITADTKEGYYTKSISILSKINPLLEKSINSATEKKKNAEELKKEVDEIIKEAEQYKVAAEYESDENYKKGISSYDEASQNFSDNYYSKSSISYSVVKEVMPAIIEKTKENMEIAKVSKTEVEDLLDKLKKIKAQVAFASEYNELNKNFFKSKENFDRGYYSSSNDSFLSLKKDALDLSDKVLLKRKEAEKEYNLSKEEVDKAKKKEVKF